VPTILSKSGMFKIHSGEFSCVIFLNLWQKIRFVLFINDFEINLVKYNALYTKLENIVNLTFFQMSAVYGVHSGQACLKFILENFPVSFF
jgi:hypothetical protein